MIAKINTYLNFDGTCEEAFNFYKSILGGEFETLSRFSDMPPQEDFTLTEEMKNLIMHVSLRIDDNTVLMGSDTGGDWTPKLVAGNNYSLSVNAKSREEVDKLFKNLSEGGNITMPLADMFWGSYFGMCTDKYGINWMIGFEEG